MERTGRWFLSMPWLNGESLGAARGALVTLELAKQAVCLVNISCNLQFIWNFPNISGNLDLELPGTPYIDPRHISVHI